MPDTGSSEASTTTSGEDPTTSSAGELEGSSTSGLEGCAALSETRCGPGGRERCDGEEWMPDPCPTSTPGCDAGDCVLRGPTMVSAGDFLVDSTEVTAAQYQAFLADRGGDVAGQPPECAWNTEFWNPTNSMNPDLWPVTYVDWCDARAFCAWAGKRLCGHRDGGPIARSSFFETSESQWFSACGGSVGASRPSLAAECNDDGNIANVGSYSTCEGYHTGLFDLVGNVAEWVDSCDGNSGADDPCYIAGGSYVDYSYCDATPVSYPRDGAARPFGFRCCSG